jgi:mitochondrial fission protein ELM1
MTTPSAHATWVISDGAAGNERQALALAEALGDATPRVWRLRAHRPWRWLAPHRLPGAQAAFGREFAQALAAPPRLAIGCGRQAALATRLLREHGVPVVQILDPRIGSAYWDVVVAPAHDRLAGANVVTLCGSLHPIDDAWLARARREFAQFAALPAPRIGLLLGGPVRAARLDEAWWDGLAEMLTHWLERDGGSLLVTGSRRTPAWLADAARERFRQVPGLRWFGEADGPNPYPGLLAWADRLVVSPDSVNLLSEACATRAPVYVHMPGPVRGRHGEFLHELVTRARIRPMKFTPGDWPATPLRELPRVAAEVRRLLDRNTPRQA